MHRHHVSVILVLCAMFAPAVRPSFAQSTGEVVRQVSAGATVSVGRGFTIQDLDRLVLAGRERVVIDCSGIPVPDSRRFVQNGAQVVADRGYAPADLLSLAQFGRNRVWVFGGQYAVPDLVRLSQFGAAIICAGNPRTFDEFKAIVAAGGQLTVDRAVKAPDVLRLAGVASGRLTVYCSGFTGPDVRSFVQRGARVVVDASIAAPEVAQLCSLGKGRVIVTCSGFLGRDVVSFVTAGSQVIVDKSLGAGVVADACARGGDRVTVRATGFSGAELAQFARSRVHIDYNTGRAEARAAKFDSLHSTGTW